MRLPKYKMLLFFVDCQIEAFAIDSRAAFSIVQLGKILRRPGKATDRDTEREAL